MKVTGIYVYPVKGLRGIALPAAMLGPQGVRYDRRFMLLTTKRNKTPTLKKMQLSSFPECALFSQEIEEGGGEKGEEEAVVVVRYHPPLAQQQQQAGDDGPSTAAAPSSFTAANRICMSPVEHPPLRIPLDPALDGLRPLAIDLHGSPTQGYRMGARYDVWFSACFGFDVVLVYIGDGRRAVLGSTLKPTLTGGASASASAAKSKAGSGSLSAATTPEARGLPGLLLSTHWPALLLSYAVAAWLALLAAVGLLRGRTKVAAGETEEEEPWITFTDCAPFLVTAESSLRNVSARLSAGVDVPMYKFRPNLVVDGAGEEAWAEDYWAALAVESSRTETASPPSPPAAAAAVRLLLTSNCVRCTSLNVDYETGARAAGELGEVLKRLSKDRRVDPGIKYSPVFGRYAFLDRRAGEGEVPIAVGDEVTVTRRNAERTAWDWPGL